MVSMTTEPPISQYRTVVKDFVYDSVSPDNDNTTNSDDHGWHGLLHRHGCNVSYDEESLPPLSPSSPGSSRHSSPLPMSSVSWSGSFQPTVTTIASPVTPSRCDRGGGPRVFFRPIAGRDRNVVKALHEEWFPVKYHEDFYDDLARGNANSTTPLGASLFTCLAALQQEEEEDEDLLMKSNTIQQQQQQQQQLIKYDEDDMDIEGGACPLDESACDDALLASSAAAAAAAAVENTDELILACVVGTFINASTLSTALQQQLLVDPLRYQRLFYIMTLGTNSQYRHLGLGTALVHKCCELAQLDPHCGVVYLHVITFNVAAIQFYEKLGFSRVEEIQDYYTIDGVNHNCYLYAKFLNGNRGHRGHRNLLSFVKDIACSLWNLFVKLQLPSLLMDDTPL